MRPPNKIPKGTSCKLKKNRKKVAINPIRDITTVNNPIFEEFPNFLSTYSTLTFLNLAILAIPFSVSKTTSPSSNGNK